MTLRKFFYCLVFAACSSSPDSRPVVGSVDSDVNLRPEQDSTEEACKDGEKRNCHTTLSTHEGVTTCFVGVQLCVDGKWSECGN